MNFRKREKYKDCGTLLVVVRGNGGSFCPVKPTIHIKKMWYNGILFTHKKDENSAVYNDMDGPEGYYA